MQNVKSIVSKALHAGYSISVWSEEGLELKRSTNIPAVMQLVQNLDVLILDIRANNGAVSIGKVQVASNEIADYSLSLKFLVE